MIIVTSSAPFSKSSNNFRKRKLGVFKFPRFEVFRQVCFRDGLVWTVGLTVEIKLRFEISPAWWYTLPKALPERYVNERFICFHRDSYRPCSTGA